eukprot:352332-Chlamydomonas_euryale.AAC.1
MFTLRPLQPNAAVRRQLPTTPDKVTTLAIACVDLTKASDTNSWEVLWEICRRAQRRSCVWDGELGHPFTVEAGCETTPALLNVSVGNILHDALSQLPPDEQFGVQIRRCIADGSKNSCIVALAFQAAKTEIMVLGRPYISAVW